MRVAEYALRLLARNVKITLTHKGKTHPIEYAEWDQVITQIKNKISAVRQLSKGRPKDDVLKLFSSAADHCEYMKDRRTSKGKVFHRACCPTQLGSGAQEVRERKSGTSSCSAS